MTAEDEPTLQALADTFGLTAVEGSSLTPSARVHRARTRDGRAVVLKVAGADAGRVRALAEWTRSLVARGVPVVTPLSLAGPNPAQVGDEWWVTYPFQEGTAYDASAEHLETAGELLGLIHTADVTPDGLREYAWPDTGREDVDGDLETLATVLTSAGDPDALEHVRALAERWWAAQSGLRSRDADLPRTAVSSDYKASNLVWTGPVPVLVDPDNGGREPRLFELAYVATMFHHECPTAPARLLEPGEWARFVAGYARHVELTAPERELWPQVFDHILWEEGTWAIEDADQDAWVDPHQRAQLLALARARVADFPLPG